MCSKDKGGSDKILNKIDVTMLTLTVLCFILSYFEHMQSDAVIKVLHSIAFVTNIYNVILLFAKLKDFYFSKKKKTPFVQEIFKRFKHFSRQSFRKTTKVAKITTIILLKLMIILIAMVYYMLLVCILLLIIIINHLGE